MIDPKLAISIEQMQRLLYLKAQGALLGEMIAFLQGEGIEAPRAKAALVGAGVATSAEAKCAIRFSEAYAVRRAADEAFEASLTAALSKADLLEQRSAAA